MPKINQNKTNSNENNAFARRSLEPVVTGLGRSFCSSSVAEARDKHYFSLLHNFVLRHFMFIGLQNMRWRSFENLTKALDFETYIKRLSLINRAGFTSSVALFIVSLLIIFPIYYKTNLAEAAGSLSDTTLSITSDNLTADVDLLVTSDSGTFASSTSPMSFNVTTNNATGYMLSISAKSGTDLTNSVAGASFTSLDAASAANGIDADAFGSINNTVYNNMWGFKPNYYKSAVNSDKFYPSPTTSGVTLNKTDSANTNADTYTIAIGARATYAQVAGTYSNTYILSAVGNYPEYKITYNDASGESSDLPSAQEADSEANDKTTVNFSDKIPTRDGYEFVGWCSVDNSTDPTSCSGTTYDPGDEYALSTLSSNIVSLYAIWGLHMQNLASSECTTAARTVYDSRDGQGYTVQRLADGNCWLLENLAFDAYAYRNKITISNTNVDAVSIEYFLNGGGTDTDNYATQGIVGSPSEYSYTQPMIYISGDCYNTTQCANDPSDGKWQSTSIVNWTAGVDSINGETGGEIGIYYNYCAATVGSYCYGSSGSANGSAEYDICPAGWRLPTGGSSGELQVLYEAVGSDNAEYAKALRLQASGAWYSYGRWQRTEGNFWGSTYFDKVRMNRLLAQELRMVQDILYRFEGGSVRCVMKEGIERMNYMQDFAGLSDDEKTDVFASMVENQQYQLIDNRDNKKYYLAKVQTDAAAPGGVVEENGKYYQVWMTQNLDLCIGCSASANGTGVATAALTSLNTDINPSSTQSIYSTSDSSTGYSTSNGVTTWTPASTAITSGRSISGTSVTGWSDSGTAPYSAEGGDYYVVTSGSTSDDTVTDSCTAGTTVCPHYHRGDYYNWTASIATNSSNGFTAQYSNADNSICPAGWRLPYGLAISDGYSDFNYLIKQQGIVTNLVSVGSEANWGANGFVNIRTNPLYFIRAGDVITNAIAGLGWNGNYWSSTVYDGFAAYHYAYFNGNGIIIPVNYSNRAYGWTIRCIVR